MIRSAGDIKGLIGLKGEDREPSDDRVPGSGNFVAQVLKEADKLEEKRVGNKFSLDELIHRVAVCMGIERGEILSSSRKRVLSKARAVISYCTIREMPAL